MIISLVIIKKGMTMAMSIHNRLRVQSKHSPLLFIQQRGSVFFIVALCGGYFLNRIVF